MTTIDPSPKPSPARPAVSATAYGYPRQGRDRELKRALERYWRGGSSIDDLLTVAAQVRAQRLETLSAAGLDELPVGDFSLYDHVLDTAWLVGAIPTRFVHAVPEAESVEGGWNRYFAMARGTDTEPPQEMTKWFDTNYHYLVPELSGSSTFRLDPSRLLAEIAEAQAYGHPVRPVVVGPVTFLSLAKSVDGDDFDPLALLDRLLPVYAELLTQLADAGVTWVQLDEPIAVTDRSPAQLEYLSRAYTTLTAAESRPKILVGSYFGHLGEAASVLVDASIDGLGVDLTKENAAATLAELAVLPRLRELRVIAGLVDGRNVWRTDLAAALATGATLLGLTGRLDVAPSCSLLHVPHDAARETSPDPEVGAWLAFADQKLAEVVTLARGLSEGTEAIAAELQANQAVLAQRAASKITRNQAVRDRAAAVTEDDLRRRSGYPDRALRQHRRLGLPALPTTTIGSFPQTAEIRKARAAFRAGNLAADAYRAAMRAEIDRVVALQTEIGVDLLVHGEPERNDMVQYFAEQLDGIVTTEHGWVQSYGSRYVRPPIIAGDITRPAPMTVEWTRYAQSRTTQPMKGMLTGPVTMLAWSFVRDDLPVADTARQMALALRDEVNDLEAAGAAAIQVDEPALRETLPLRTADRADYLRWAVDAFRLSTAGVTDETQIHTHMCYAEFGDILPAIIELDADVISLKAARSRMEVVSELAEAGYPREVGPGVWDIHAPRVPSTEEILDSVRLACTKLPADRIWINPDCGLKTRSYTEVEPSLRHLVTAARQLRTELIG
ncbi:MAG: 5-methyltetrahydropteroyltriglutamate--homocysteine S-methyltransferase [Microlunatus sp.]